MKQIKLSFRPATQPLRPAVAWFLHGDDPAVWLDALGSRSTLMTEWTLLAIPAAPGELRPCGVLAFSKSAVDKNSQGRSGGPGRCPAYGVVGERLFVPVEAELSIDVDDNELGRLLGPHLYVFHPSTGLIAFEPQDRLRVADLFASPAVVRGSWDAAEPGVAVNERLLSVRPLETPQWEEIVRQGQEDIGSRSDDVQSLPPAPNEPSGGVTNRVGRSMLRGIACAVRRFLSSSAGAAGGVGSPLLKDLNQWAEKTVQRLDRAAQDLRNKEINRLLNLLHTNPDEGLRHAIPTTGGEHRGVARPSSRLTRHRVDFNLDWLRGGGPVDFWNIPPNIHCQLTSHYRRLADRELALGRYRRAAYIHAELLGDLRAAASCLKQGRLWREAAVLYRERLQAPKEAAQCLEEGGLISEAIALYEELGEWIKVGELHRQLGRNEEAKSAYRRAVDKAVFRGDRVGAAELLETKLGRVDEAIDQLVSAWPWTSQARPAFAALFGLYARHARHEDAARRIAALRKDDASAGFRATLIELLCDVPSEYPDAAVGEDAADAARVLAAEHLSQSPPSDVSQVIGAIRRLVPSDRLLGRDCHRFARRAIGQAPPTARKPLNRGRRMELVHEFALPRGVEWLTALSLDDSSFAAVGHGELKPDEPRKLVLVCAGFDRIVQLRAFNLANPAPPGAALMLAPYTDKRQIRLKLRDNDSPELVLPPTAGTFNSRLIFHWPASLPPDPWGAVGAPDGSTWTLAQSENWKELVLWAHDTGGAVLSSRPLPVDAPWLGDLAQSRLGFVPMVFARGRVYFAAGRWLVSALPRGGFDQIETCDEIVSLSATSPHHRPRIAVSFRNGGAVFWDQYDGTHSRPLDRDLHEPITTFSRFGHLIAADTAQCQVYETSGGELKLTEFLDELPGRPCAILPTCQRSQFGLLFGDGRVAVYG